MARHFRSVRARTTATACLVLGSFFLLGGVGFLVYLNHSLVRGVDQAATVLAEDVMAEVEAGHLPPVLAASGEEHTLVQVVDGSGNVLAASVNLQGEPPVVGFRPADGESAVRTLRSLPLGDEETYRVVALALRTPTVPVTVYVGRSLEDAGRRLLVAGTLLAVGLPLLLLLGGISTWVAVGRALRPVEAIRAEVADVGAHDLGRRVPEPDTGDEIARLAATMNAMLDRLQASVERQRRFVGDASHELHSPLAALRAELEVALARPEAADWPGTAVRLLGDVEREEQLVRDLLFLARADEDATLRRRLLVDLDDVVLAEVERARARSSMPVDASRVSAAPVRGHREDLARVVRNLLDNAARHARTGVRVEVSTEDGWALLTVHDDGAGIPLEGRQRVFERFTRLDAGRSRREGGAGLGLAIAKDVVVAHGGTITVEDSPVGARLLVRLPASA